MNNIIENNKLIAEFMGYKYFPFNSKLKKKRFKWLGWRKDKLSLPKGCTIGKIGERYYLDRRHKDLKFHEDWDWLMPVVEKINKLEDGVEKISISPYWGGTGLGDESFDNKDDIAIIQTYKAVIKFIKNYKNK